MAINFPSSPSLNQTFTQGSVTWRYNGTAWVIVTPSSLTLENLTVSENSALTDVTVSNDLTVNNNLVVDGDLTVSGSVGFAVTFNGGTITNPLIINNNTPTTGVSSGALRITGGVAVGDDIFLAGTLTVEDENIELRTSGEIRFYNTSNTNYVGFSSPNTISTNRIYVLPQTDGSSGQFLRTDGLGNLSWASAAGAGGGTPPGGLNTQVQFNDSNTFGGNAAFTFNSSTQLLTVPDLTATGNVAISDSTASTNSTSGALTVTGGAGIQGQINVAGASNKFTGNTASTSTTTGTIVVTGGLGVSGSINVGSTVTSSTDPTDADHLTNKRYVDANTLAFSVAFGA